MWKITPFLEKLATVNDVREYIREVVSMNQINYKKINEILEKDSDLGIREEVFEIREDFSISPKKSQKLMNTSTSSTGTTKLNQSKSLTVQPPKASFSNTDKNQTSTSSNNFNTGYKTENNKKLNGTSTTYNTSNVILLKTPARTNTNFYKKQDSKNTVLTQVSKTNLKNASTVTSNLNKKSPSKTISKKCSSVVTTKSKTSKMDTSMTSYGTLTQSKNDGNSFYKTNQRNTNNFKPGSPTKLNSNGNLKYKFLTIKLAKASTLKRTSSQVSVKISGKANTYLTNPELLKNIGKSPKKNMNTSGRYTYKTVNDSGTLAGSSSKTDLNESKTSKNSSFSINLLTPQHKNRFKDLSNISFNDRPTKNNSEDKFILINNQYKNDQTKKVFNKQTSPSKSNKTFKDKNSKMSSTIPNSTRGFGNMNIVYEIAETEASKILSSSDDISRKSSKINDI